MKAILFYYLFTFLCISLSLSAQPQCHIIHYSLKDGLPQRSIMDIIQDKKGFIWLATWDGLCKFDGYNFTTYKSSTEDSIFIKNNRIDKIYEDAYGYIWIYTYNKEAFRFDPASEKFITSFNINRKPFYTSQIIPMPSGKVWLASNNNGVICIPSTDNKVLHFGNGDKTKLSDKINMIYEDSHKYSWILTDDGLLRISPDLSKQDDFSAVFSPSGKENKKIPVFTAFENNNEIWFGSDFGRIFCYNREDNKFRLYQMNIASNIISIKKIYNNTYIILTSNNGFVICDQNKTIIKQINTTTNKNLPTDEMLSSYIDRNNNIWIETNTKGVAKFNLEKNLLKYYKPNDYGNNHISYPSFFILEDNSGRIWIHPHGGLSYYDEKNDKLHPFYNDPNSFEWKFSDILHNAFIDKQGNIWLSTRTGGLEKIVFDNTLFRLNDFYSNKISTTGFEVRAIFEDSNHNIWIGNKKGQISIFDSNKNFKGFLCKDGSISKTGTLLNAIAVYAFCQASDGSIWIGTKGCGVFVLTPSNNKYNIKQYKHTAKDKYSLSNDAVYTMHEDADGRMWIGTYGGGLNRFDKQNDRFINHLNDLKYPVEIGSQVRSTIIRKGMMYVGTTLGLIVFPLNSEKNYKFYSKTYKSQDGLKANDVYNLYITKSNDLYVATFGGGMSKVESYDKHGFPINFKTYDASSGLNSDIVLSIIEDNDGRLWLNSEGNLSRFDRKNEVFESFNDVSQIISNQYFTEASPLLTSEGELIYGCTHGTLSFAPDKIARNEYIPYLALTQFKVLNNILPLKNKIDDIDKIELNHNENAFSIEYAALDYQNPQSISYAYKLDGFDEKWINGQQRTANYTNIPPGKYVFRVKSTNSNGTWIENERKLEIRVKPSFFETYWAYFIYMILLFLLLYTILRSIFIFYRMKDRVLLEQEQTEMKTRFFTDISHEIRTPLTMIVSPLENIISDKQTSDQLKSQLYLMQRNANRMLKMVNQILDFRKIQTQKLHVRETIIGDYIRDLCIIFQKNIEYNEIEFTFDNSVGDKKLWVDIDSIEKLIYNLISNSIKYTRKKDRIEVSLFAKDKGIALLVKDSGEGMTKDVINKLFTRFASFNLDKSKPSTGIGLSIVKEVADKHHAKIIVDSDINKGSSFTVLFQTGTEHFNDDPNVDIILDDSESGKPANDIDAEQNNIVSTEDNECGHRLSILVVEDDSELRGFIKSVLVSYYHVYEAKDGQEGYNSAVKNNPDFILSDIMMPEMDGIEFLKAIRNNHNTSHIPFILLTAKTSSDDKLEGTISGADDYISKPFSIKLLIAKIENIIKQRKRLTDYLSARKDEYKTSEEELAIRTRITEKDEQFLQNLQKEIDNNLDNSDFLIDDLVAKTNLSRRVFFNKVKSLTGLAPVEFIREIRLKHAAKLLRDPQYRIKEVVYMVGFSDIRYFTQCFKKMYGMPPSQYRDQLKNK